MIKQRFKCVVAVHLFLVENDKILLLRRFNTGYEDGNYSVPAGHLDGGESASQAMIREAKEEVGIDIKSQDLKMIHAMHRKSQEERIDFFFEARKWQEIINIMEQDKCDDLSWFPVKKLPRNIVPYVRAAIREYLKNNIFSEFGWD